MSEGYRRQTRTVIFQGLAIFSGTVAFARCHKPSGTAKVRPQVLSVGGLILELRLELTWPCDKVHDDRLYTVDGIVTLTHLITYIAYMMVRGGAPND